MNCNGTTKRGWNVGSFGQPGCAVAVLLLFAAAGVANNGDLLAITTGWTGRDLSGKKTGRPFRERIDSTWISRSTDGGKTWSVDKSSFPTLPAGEIVVPFGDILPGHDGWLRVAMHHRQRTYVFRSCDDGRTWGEPVTAATAEGKQEASPAAAPSDTALADGETSSSEPSLAVEPASELPSPPSDPAAPVAAEKPPDENVQLTWGAFCSDSTEPCTPNPDGPFRERRESLLRSTTPTMPSLHRDAQYRTHAFEPISFLAMGSPPNSRARAKMRRATVNGYQPR